MAGFDNDVVYGTNVDFRGVKPVVGQFTANGQLLIGSTASPFARVGSLTSVGATLNITTGAGTINIETSGSMVPNTITGDSGGALSPSAGNWNILGQQASTIPVMDSIGSASTLKIENRAWVSQYVVDTSSTTGLRGTFTSLQAAVTQAVADGATGSNNRTIFVRNTSSTESVAFPNNTNLNIVGIGASGLNGNPSIINGNITFGTTCTVNFTNMSLVAGSGVVVTIPSVTTVSFTSCFINQTGAGTAVSVTGDTGSINFTNCYIPSKLVQASTCTTSIDAAKFYGCIISGEMDLNSTTTGVFRFFDCTIASVVLTNAGLGEYFGCYFVNGGISGTTTGTKMKLYGNIFDTSVGAGSPFVTATGTFWVSGNIGEGGTLLYSSSPTIVAQPKESGNILASLRVAGNAAPDYTVSYIGITDTSSPRTVTLPTTGVNKNQIFTIKDESGGAASHNITVSVSGGVKLIDGSASFVMNTNYGSLQVIYDGTNYFIF